jgi:hypothetical protein
MPKYACLGERIIANSVLADVFFEGTACWWWIGATNGRYGKITIRSTRVVNGKRKIKSKLVHRLVRIVFKGEIYRRGNYARHVCPPHPNRYLCCNPDHIWPGTPRQNNRDTVREGRHKPGTANQHGRFARRSSSCPLLVSGMLATDEHGVVML